MPSIRVHRCLSVVALVFMLIAFGTATGDRPIVARVQIEGARSVLVRDVQGWLVTRAGVAVDSALLRKDVQRILEGYKKQGFWQVAVGFPKMIRGDQTTVVFAIAERGANPGRVCASARRVDF